MKFSEALQPYRSKVFLAEKTMRRDAKGARSELERDVNAVRRRVHAKHGSGDEQRRYSELPAVRSRKQHIRSDRACSGDK